MQDRIRTVKRTDLEELLAWRNHPDVRAAMYSRAEITPAEHAAWFDRCNEDPWRHLLIYEHEGIPSGYASLASTPPFPDVYTWGFYLAPDAVGRLGRCFGRAVLDHAFSNLRAYKVCGEVLANNSRSAGYHERLGFLPEGCLRQQYCDDSSRVDVLLYGLLKTEWLAVREELEK